MKSVLHIALIAPGGYSNKGIMDGFLAAGFSSYNLFDFQLHIYNNDKETMRRTLIAEAEKIKPDLIFCQIQSSEILDTETFRMLSKIAFTVNYTFDIRSKEKTEWLYDLAPVIGLICFSNQRDVDECKRRGHYNAMVLQSSADFDVYKPGKVKCTCTCHNPGSVEIHFMPCCNNGYVDKRREGVVFVGNNFSNTNHEFPLSEEREKMVKMLQYEFTDQFKVYGRNWGMRKMTTQKEEIEIYQSALIAVNHNNFDEELYTSDRIWRLMACGALCLTKYFKGIEKLFTRNEHLDWWETLDELKQKIDRYLSYPYALVPMARSGMQHVRGNHNWQCRIAEMIHKIKGLIPPEIRLAGCMDVGAHVIDGVIPGAFDEQFDNRVCECGKIKFLWQECGCQEKIWQLRAQENI